MHVATRLGAYAAVLAVIVTGAFAAGSAVGPPATATDSATAPDSVTAAPAHGDTHAGEAHDTGTATDTADGPGGLATTERGYTLVPAAATLAVGTAGTFAFTVTGSDGAPVTAFDVEHDKRMHLIVVRRDGTAFQHVHPEMAPDGTWSVPLAVPAGGSYRAFADFTPTGGPATTLGVDLSAAGVYEPALHAASRVAQVDGYTVELAGDLVPGQTSPVVLTVARGGVPVGDLQPYLGAYGHLVALREGDLAYLHVHPEGAPGDGVTAPGPRVEFATEVPSAGTYRLFLDFQHEGVVRTAEFTVATAGAGADHGEPGHGH